MTSKGVTAQLSKLKDCPSFAKKKKVGKRTPFYCFQLKCSENVSDSML